MGGMRRRGATVFLAATAILAGWCAAAEAPPFSKADGYRGIWFTLGQLTGEHGDKYSGGLGTYTAKHIPLAIYAPKVNKTFFVYGGTTAPKERHLLAMVSYYDHARGVVPRPTIVHDKGGVNDPHDNPSIALDSAGHVWVFVSGRGRHRPGFKYRSLAPYSIEAFERISTEEMTYPQPHVLPGLGFFHCFTKYTAGRELYWETSADGRTWTPDALLAGFGGHYQVSADRGGRVATAFNWHPGGNVDKRTNLYYVETDDFGRTWKTAGGRTVATPLRAAQNDALVRDFAAEGRLVYMKDLTFDAEGRPVILMIVSRDFRPGPQGDPREWTLAHWTGETWAFRVVTTSDHNYDMGSLYIEADRWRVLAPTDPGPQPWGTGGEMVLWESRDEGATWQRVRNVTAGSARNHAYARRPVGAHPDFYAFWADGNPFELSESHLYFTNQAGDCVWRLPPIMTEDFARPEPVR